jgi:hypothetical protein
MTGSVKLGDVLTNWDEMDWVDIGGIRMAYVLQRHMPNSVIFLVDRPPHHKTAAHSHPLPHIEVLLEGSLEYGGERPMRAGDFRVVDGEVAYGPLIAGPEGAKCIEISPELDQHFSSTVTDPDYPEAYEMNIEEATKNMMVLYDRAKADLEAGALE